jgi:hypothetical protein
VSAGPFGQRTIVCNPPAQRTTPSAGAVGETTGRPRRVIWPDQLAATPQDVEIRRLTYEMASRVHVLWWTFSTRTGNSDDTSPGERSDRHRGNREGTDHHDLLSMWKGASLYSRADASALFRVQPIHDTRRQESAHEVANRARPARRQQKSESRYFGRNHVTSHRKVGIPAR